MRPNEYSTRTRIARWVRPALTLSLLGLLGIVYLFSETFRAEVDHAAGIIVRGDVAALKDYILSYGAWAPLVSASLMVLQALAAFIPAFVLAFANGMAFGAFWGGLLSLTSAALAAAISFGIARVLGRAFVEALVGRQNLGAVDHWFARYGAYAVLIARLIPVVSFDAVSYAAGLTKMSFLKFVAATTLGMLPATAVYSYLGEQAPQYVNLLLVIFGLFVAGAVVYAVIRRRRKGKPVP